MQKKKDKRKRKDVRHMKNKMMADINQTISVIVSMDG